MVKFYPWWCSTQLLYVGDAYPRVIVTPVRDPVGINGMKHTDRRLLSLWQYFKWPNGEEHAVPHHTVVPDNPAVRMEKGLDL